MRPFSITIANDFSRHVDLLALSLLGVSIFFIVLICTLITVFVIRYARTPANPVAREVRMQPRLEIFWTLVPLAITIFFFAWGARQFMTSIERPAHAEKISVLAKQWMWKFRTMDGIEEINDLHLPVGHAFELSMISQDVIHSFYVPELRVKYDVLPGRYTQLMLTPEKSGVFTILCTQYCGTDHSKMIGHLIVLPEAEYQTWLKTQAVKSEQVQMAEGEALFREKACTSCHESRRIGPDLHGVAGSMVHVVDARAHLTTTGTAQGRAVSEGAPPVQTIYADDDYLRDSILNPSRLIVAGYRDVMPSFKGQLSEDEIESLLHYIKNLKNARPPKRGDEL